MADPTHAKTLDPHDRLYHNAPRGGVGIGPAAEPDADVVGFKHHGCEVS